MSSVHWTSSHSLSQNICHVPPFFVNTSWYARELANVQCFGTDGETALIDSCKQVFTSSLNLICFIHVRRNISAKIQELRISEGTKMMILDIFGKSVGSHHTEGLVDATTDSSLGAKCG